MEPIKSLLILIFLELALRIASLGLLSDSLGLLPNLIINSNFSINSPFSSLHGYYFFNKSIQGWTCTNICQIDSCFYLNQHYVPTGYIFADCSDQIIDLNSIVFNEAVSQQLYLKAGIYRLGFNYYLPWQNANLKTLHVQVNQEEVFTLSPTVQKEFSLNNIEIDVHIIEGMANISFFNTGYALDSSGFKINNVSLRMYYNPISTSFINSTMNNPVLNSICSVPGYRVIFGQLMNFLVNLDRFELYSYHNRTYSYHWTIFLNTVYNLKQLQGTLLGSIGDKAQQWINGLSFKQNYDYQSQILQQQLNVDSLLQIDNSFFGCSLPLSCLQVFVFCALFRLLFDYPISLFFRRFYFVVTMLVLIITEGNVEHVTFFIFGQILTLFSACFTHKVVNVLLILFFFVMVILIFSFQLWLLCPLKRHQNNIFQGYRAQFYGVVGCIINKGAFCMTLGVVHRLLMSNHYQLLVLSFIQIAWLVVRCILLALNIYQYKVLSLFEILSSIVRIQFILSTYLYQDLIIQIQILLNQSCDITLIILTILISLVYFLTSIFFIVQFTRKTLSKIVNNKQQSNKKDRNPQIAEKKQTIKMFTTSKIKIIQSGNQKTVQKKQTIKIYTSNKIRIIQPNNQKTKAKIIITIKKQSKKANKQITIKDYK